MKTHLRRVAWCLAVAIALPSGTALADDKHDHDKDRDRHDHDRDHDKDHKDDHRYPREAPPAAKEEKYEVKKGQVWVAGRWDWKDGKWEWMAGRYEAERPGKRYEVGRWEKRGDHYELVEGTWVDDKGEPPHEVARTDDHPRREWRKDAPTVNNYWPQKGKPGQHVVVRGIHFPAGTVLEFNGAPLANMKAGDVAVMGDIPADAKPGVGNLDLKMERHHLAVGSFEVVPNYDADAEAKRIAAEERKAAEAAWAARQKELDADRAKRQAAIEKAEQERERTREERRRQREEEIRKKFEAAFLADPDTQAELTLHAERVATIQRMKDVIEEQNDAKLGVRIQLVEKKENDRHEARMAALLAAFKANGGAK